MNLLIIISYYSKSDTINGITLSIKSKDNVIQVWNHKADSNREGIERKIKEIAMNDDIKLFYKFCKDPNTT